MPVNPKIAATIEIRKNMRAHFNNVIDVPFHDLDSGVYSNSTLSVAFPNRPIQSFGRIVSIGRVGDKLTEIRHQPSTLARRGWRIVVAYSSSVLKFAE
jgi:hypothetical protein